MVKTEKTAYKFHLRMLRNTQKISTHSKSAGKIKINKKY